MLVLSCQHCTLLCCAIFKLSVLDQKLDSKQELSSHNSYEQIGVQTCMFEGTCLPDVYIFGGQLKSRLHSSLITDCLHQCTLLLTVVHQTLCFSFTEVKQISRRHSLGLSTGRCIMPIALRGFLPTHYENVKVIKTI